MNDEATRLQDALHAAFEQLEEAHLLLDVVLTHPGPDDEQRLGEAEMLAEEYLEALRRAQKFLREQAA